MPAACRLLAALLVFAFAGCTGGNEDDPPGGSGGAMGGTGGGVGGMGDAGAGGSGGELGTGGAAGLGGSAGGGGSGGEAGAGGTHSSGHGSAPYVLAPSPDVTEGDLYVDGTNGDDANDGRSASSAFRTIGKALAAVGDGETILVRHATYRLSTRLVFSSQWTQGVKVWAYGNERPEIDCSALPNGEGARCLYLNGGRRWHLKGFEVTGAHSDSASIQVTNAHDNVIEDIWIHDFPVGSGVNIYKGDRNLIVDVVVNRMGDPARQDTNVADGFACNGTFNVFVRCVSVDGPDDGFDFFFGHDNEVHDSVAIRSGYYFNGSPGGSSGGDGNGFKGGGSSSSSPSGRNKFFGCIASGSRTTGFSHNQATLGGVEFHSCTSVENGSGFDLGGGSGQPENLGVNNISWSNDAADYIGPNATARSNTWQLGIDDPGFVDPQAGDYHLGETSACLGAGEDGKDLGASTVALELHLLWK